MTQASFTTIVFPPVREIDPALIAMSNILDLKEALEDEYHGLDREVARVLSLASRSLAKIYHTRHGIK
jgi:hypothetical protein